MSTKSRPLGKDPSRPKTIQGIVMPEQIASGKRRPMEEILAEQGLLDEPADSAIPASEGVAATTELQTGVPVAGSTTTTIKIPLDSIAPSPFQPRRLFNQELLEDLADNILTHGLLHPIIVRPVAEGKYELVGGERRVRAHRMLGKDSIEASVVPMDDYTAMAVALADNTGSEPLTAFEQARGVKLMMDKVPNSSINQLSRHTGINKGTISKNMRFFQLPPEVIEMLEENPSLLGQSQAIDMARYCPDHNDLVIEAAVLIQTGRKTPAKAIDRLHTQVRNRSRTPIRSGRQVLNLIDQRNSVTQAVVSGKKITLECTSMAQSEDVLKRIIKALGITVLDDVATDSTDQGEAKDND